MRGKSWAFLGGVGVGALVMYFLDPDAGSRRRIGAREKMLKAGRSTGEAIEGKAKVLADQARRLAERARSRFDPGTPADDVLAQRVRSSLGRVISHPRMISIAAAAGVVTLTGTVSEEEAKGLSATVRGVEGVQDVVDQTEVREEMVR